MTGRRIVTRHLVRRTAEKELARLWKLQADAAAPDAAAELAQLGITATTTLAVRQERKRFYKWGIVAS